jgi:two-component system copper resistance phosphate regulon response regulator CusR
MSTRILVIEDEVNIADYLVRGLREEGFVVEHAADGLSGLLSLRSGPWDLVLLDWWLPGRDGLEILRRFRERDRRTPVLFLTARDHVRDRVLGLDSGADNYLCKPFDFDELLARIRALIRRRDGDAGEILVHADVTVNLASQRAERAGRPLDLTAKELTLLAYFLRNPSRVLTRLLVYEQVWDEPFDASSNTLGVHIMELRRKLEAHGPRIIHTVRRRGFLLGEAAGLPRGEEP